MFKAWFNVLVSPKKTFEEEKTKASFKLVLFNWIIFGLVIGFVLTLLVFLHKFELSYISNYYLGLEQIMWTLLLGIVISLIGNVFSNMVFFTGSRLFGGKGHFKEQCYLTSLSLIGIALLTLILSIVPFIGSIILIIVDLYAFVLLLFALKETHEFSLIKSLLTVIIIPIILLIIAFLIFGSLIFGLSPIPFAK